MASLAHSSYFIGSSIGSIFMGYSADRTAAGSAAFALASVWLYRVLGEEAVPQIDLLPAVPSPQSR